MRSGGASGGTDITDNFASSHFGASLRAEFSHMRVKGLGAVRMLYNNHIAITAAPAGFRYKHSPGSRGVNWRAFWRPDIYAAISRTMKALSFVTGRQWIYEIAGNVGYRVSVII